MLSNVGEVGAEISFTSGSRFGMRMSEQIDITFQQVPLFKKNTKALCFVASPWVETRSEERRLGKEGLRPR